MLVLSMTAVWNEVDGCKIGKSNALLINSMHKSRVPFPENVGKILSFSEFKDPCFHLFGAKRSLEASLNLCNKRLPDSH